MAGKGAIVVTGVSTGIGWGAARVLTEKGFTVFGSVRKAEDGERLSKELGANFVPLLFDVTDEATVKHAAAVVREALDGRRLLGLVNNAGIAVGGPLLYLPVADFRKQLEVNLTGALIATQAFGPLLGVEEGFSGPPGRIVNIGSVGGRHAFPFMGPYHTTKYGLEGFTESLRRELMPFGIDAILVAPGTVATPIWGKADRSEYGPYEKTIYREPLKRLVATALANGKRGLPPERLGEAIHEALTAPRPKTYYRVTPAPLEFWALTRLPKRLIDRVIARRIGLLPKDS